MNELILPIDKPVGWTSFDVVAKLRGGLKWKKVGHAGTLDPAATGLLIILCGDATTRADEFMELGKTYRAVAKLGVVTDSDDLDGEVIAEHDVQWNERLIESELRSFIGEIAQRPPAVSAIRIGGKRSYKLARAGRAVELPERPVHVHSLDIVEMNKPFVTFEMRCSKGTYVRSIARDLGERLGCGGTLAALRRTAVGPIEVRDAWTLSAALAIPEFRGEPFLMIIHRDRLAQDVLQGKRSAVTVGSLDGLHVGHQVILSRLKELAAQHGEAPIVVTFDPHPRSLVDGGIRPISLLQSSAEKHDTLRTLGVEHLLVLSFDETIRRLSAREFIEQYVLRAWQANRIVAGYNHSFGKDRSGDRESLITMGRELNFGVEILPPVSVDGQTVSSTTIRRMLMEGELPSANAMLGRPYTLSGRVVRGFGRGRRMGCPTANLEEFASGKLIPRDGIYAAFAIVDGTDYPAAVSIGFNPTFGGQRHSVEAHILDFDRDLYGAVLSLKFVKRLRGEIKFSGEAALSDQMRQDLADIRDILRAEGYGDGPRPSQQQQAFRQQQ